MKVGDAVTAIVYGRHRSGVVTRMRRPDAAVVWVKWYDATRETWMHADSLTVIPTDNPKEGE